MYSILYIIYTKFILRVEYKIIITSSDFFIIITVHLKTPLSSYVGSTNGERLSPANRRNTVR